MNRYYWSKYNVIFNNKEKKLLYNSLSNALWEIDDAVHEDIKNLQKTIERGEYNGEHKIHSRLVEASIITEDTQEDTINKLKLKSLLDRTFKDVQSLSILPTLDCNFNCVYCYESERPSIYMTDETEKKLINYIISEKSRRFLSIDWLGGEPLLAYDRIVSITQKLKDNNIQFESSLITNGYLLTKEVADELSDLKITMIQITIDGIGEKHNKRRPHIKTKRSYETIIENIKYLYDNYKDVIGIQLRVNVDKTNQDDFFYICTELSEMFPGIEIYPGIVTETNACTSINSCIFSKEDLISFLRETKEKHGLKAMSFFPDMGGQRCMAENLFCYVIGPEGELYKCWNDVGIKERQVGFLNDTGVKISNYKCITRYAIANDPLENPDCLDCQILPQCMGGGCPYKRNQKKYENINIDYCSYFKNNLEEFISKHYEDKVSTVEE
ncbi:MAG: radical SAM protein [Bacteroidales bacterium]|nr:radical SAM protein [Bacteroidales bacterium]